MATKVIVNIPGEEAYDVRIGTGVLDALGARMRGVPSLEQAERVLVVTDENVAPLYRDRARESLAAAGFRVPDIVVPAGEDTKSVEVAGEIWAVSYTHLDVYKRQAPGAGRPREAGRQLRC